MRVLVHRAQSLLSPQSYLLTFQAKPTLLEVKKIRTQEGLHETKSNSKWMGEPGLGFRVSSFRRWGSLTTSLRWMRVLCNHSCCTCSPLTGAPETWGQFWDSMRIMGTKERRPAEKWLDFNSVTQRENWVRDLEVCGEDWLCLERHGSADYLWEEEDHF